VQIDHLDGKKVSLNKDSVTKPDEVQTIADQGMPDFEEGHKNGNLYVKYTVRFPEKLTEQMKAMVKQIFSLMHDEL
jgi:DnaJ-class molecular chaperone